MEFLATRRPDKRECASGITKPRGNARNSIVSSQKWIPFRAIHTQNPASASFVNNGQTDRQSSANRKQMFGVYAVPTTENCRRRPRCLKRLLIPCRCPSNFEENSGPRT